MITLIISIWFVISLGISLFIGKILKNIKYGI